MNNLYDNPIKFFLKSSLFDIEIIEPLNIRDADFVIERDKEFYGFVAQYLDEGSRLEFSNEDDSGRKEIEQIFEQFGTDGEIEFSMKIFYENKWQTLIRANLNLNDKDSTVETFSCSISKVSFSSLFRTRYETNISVDTEETLDGETASRTPSKQIDIQAQPIQKFLYTEYLADIDPTGLDVSTDDKFELIKDKSSGFTPEYIVAIPRIKIELDQFETNTDVEPAIVFFPIDRNPEYHLASSGYKHFTASRAGIVDIQLSSYYFNYSARTNKNFIDFDGRPETDWTMKLSVCQFDKNGSLKRNVILQSQMVRSATECNLYSAAFTGRYNLSLNMAEGDGFVIYSVGYQLGSYKEDYVRMTMNFGLCFSASQVEDTPLSKCQVWMLKDVMTHNLIKMTGKNSFKSDFLDSCAANISLTNGSCIRDKYKPLETNMKELFDAIHAMFNIGYTISQDEDGNDLLVIEKMNHFFQNKKILTIEEVFDYKESVDKDVMYNEVEIGYEKYIDESEFGLDAFNTKREYLLPIRSYKKKLSLKSKIIADGYLIEKARSYQYLKEQPATTSEDEMNFFLCLNEAKTTSLDDHIVELSGCPSPLRSYNYKISPARMFYHWRYFVNSILSVKPNGQAIKNTLCVKNDRMNGIYNDCSGLIQIREGQDFEVDNSCKLFTPNLASLKTRMDFESYMKLQDALLDKGSEEFRNGFIEVFAPSEIIRIFVKKFKYNPITEIAEVTGWKKY